MTDLVPIRRALFSVSDKTDLVPFASALAGRGVEILSTGGTAKALEEAGIAVRRVEDLTGVAEMLDGRVKTLHPAVHAGLLAKRDHSEHLAAMKSAGFEPIDLICVNLYPFERVVSRLDTTFDLAIENIDVGGPAMIRAASKNAEWVTVVTNPRQYDRVAAELSSNEGATTSTLRRALAADAFARTAAYDRAIAAYLAGPDRAFPPVLSLDYTIADELRYGENPHQSAAVYRDPASTGPTVVNAEQLHGKHLSYNNFLDGAAALEVVKTVRRLSGSLGPGPLAGACVVKHTNPCGAAIAADLADAVTGAIAGDPMAAFGGVLAVNRVVDERTADRIAAPDRFFEIVIAPEFEPIALSILRERWKNVRLLAVGERPSARQRKLDYRSIPGGMLVQDRDIMLPTPARWRHTAGPAPTDAQVADAAMLAVVGRSLTSNAVAIGGRDPDAESVVRLFGAGAGQMDRVAACRLAIQKAGERAAGSIAVSDAFFPFPDGPELLIDAGVKCIVHPGGAKRDDETFALCNDRGVTCMITGTRRFRH